MLEMAIKVVSALLILFILVGTCVLLLEIWWFSKRRAERLPGSSLTPFEKLVYAFGDFCVIAGEWKDYFILKVKEIFTGYKVETDSGKYPVSQKRMGSHSGTAKSQGVKGSGQGRYRLKV